MTNEAIIQATLSSEPAHLHATLQGGIEGRPGAEVYKTRYEFPNIGNKDVVYCDETANALYRWDSTEGKYYCVGRDYEEIKIIDAGEV